MDYNKTILAGHLTADPELKYTPDGLAICNFTLAVNNGYGDKKEVLFIKITCFKLAAEFATKYLMKGNNCLVDGYLKQDKWEDKDGQKRTSFSIIAREVKSLSIKTKTEPEPETREPGGDIPF